MGIVKKITIGGGWSVPAYMFPRSASLDKMTGLVEVLVWMFPSEEARREFEAAMAKVKEYQELMRAPYDGMEQKQVEKASAARVRRLQDAQDKLSECQSGTALGTYQIEAPIAAEFGILRDDASIDYAKIYEYFKRNGGPFAGGEDRIDPPPEADQGGSA